METADRVAAWITAHLTWLPDAAEPVLGLPVLALATFVALLLLVRQVLPRLGALAFGWLVPALGYLLTVIWLTLEFAATRPFRWAGARPPAMLYGAGNSAVGFDGAVGGLCRATVRQIERFSRLWNVLLLAAAVYGVYRWGLGYCDRHPAAGCTGPVDAWLTSVGDAYDRLRG
jgi:hypothetical protein